MQSTPCNAKVGNASREPKANRKAKVNRKAKANREVKGSRVKPKDGSSEVTNDMPFWHLAKAPTPQW